MISEDRVEAAVEYLRDTAKQYGQARGRALYTENHLRRVKALVMLEHTGSIGEREAQAYGSEAYQQALKDMEDAVAESETIRALREAASYTIEVWRSQNSTRRQGNV